MKLAQINELRSADAATKNLCEHLDKTFNITAIDRLYYQGAPAGSEYLTYAATKLYLALDISMLSANGSNTIGQGVTAFYNELNAIVLNAQNQSCGYDGALPYYVANYFSMQNMYFSRLVQGSRITWMKFNGYRLTIA